MSWVVLRNAASVVILAAAFATAVGVLAHLKPVRWVFAQLIGRPITEWHQRSVREVVNESTGPLADRQQAMADQIHTVEQRTAELITNSGMSLKDTVGRMESMLLEHLEESAYDRAHLWEVLAEEGVYDRRDPPQHPPESPEEPEEHP